MIKQVTACIALGCAGTALAAPFSVAGTQIGATGDFATPDVFPGVPAFALLGGGVFWDAPALTAGAPGVGGSNLIGAHPGYFPGVADSAIGPTSGGVGALVAMGDPLDSASDTSFDVGWTIPDAADYVASASLPPTDIGGGLSISSGNSMWLGRVVGQNVVIDTVSVQFTEDPFSLVSFAVNGSGESTPSGTLFAITVPVPGVPGAVDILLGDLIVVVPSPGGGALFGMACVSARRRRRL